MNNQLIKALVFDAYGTLFDVYSISELCEALFPGRGKDMSHLWRTKQLEYTWLCSQMGRYEDFEKITAASLKYVCGALRLDCGQSDFKRLADAYLDIRLFPEVRASLESLKDFDCSILSNGSPWMLRELFANAKLESVFHHIISVEEVKVYKPDPRVYALAEQRTGVPKDSIGFVSANSWDACGAASFGFHSFWINRASAYPDELGHKPHRILVDLSELHDVLASDNRG